MISLLGSDRVDKFAMVAFRNLQNAFPTKNESWVHFYIIRYTEQILLPNETKKMRLLRTLQRPCYSPGINTIRIKESKLRYRLSTCALSFHSLISCHKNQFLPMLAMPPKGPLDITNLACCLVFVSCNFVPRDLRR